MNTHKTRLVAILIAAIAFLATAQASHAYISMTYTGSQVTVISGDDESGYFSWEVTRGPTPFLFGVDSAGLGSFNMPAYGVQSVTDPAGWSSTMSGGQVIWTYDGPGVWFIEDVPVTFGYQSSITAASVYGSGIVIGDLYDLGHNPVIGVGFENFDGFAPIPEPGTWALLVMGAATICACRFRRRKH